jgi:hypothetical protein
MGTKKLKTAIMLQLEEEVCKKLGKVDSHSQEVLEIVGDYLVEKIINENAEKFTKL